MPDSPGRNAGLSRKKCRTLQEEMPDSPGRNAGLSRKKCRTLQEICSRVFLQTIGFCERCSCIPVYVLLYCLFINNRGLQSAKGGSMAGRQASSRPARPKAEEHHVKAESNLEEYPFFAIKRRNLDRKSTRLNSSHANISYAVFCLKKNHAVLISKH